MAPHESVREKVRQVIGPERFVLVHLTCPVEVCRERDADGHYAKADSGDIANFPGVSAPYDTPSNPDLVLSTDTVPVEECVDQIMKHLGEQEIIQ